MVINGFSALKSSLECQKLFPEKKRSTSTSKPARKKHIESENEFICRFSKFPLSKYSSVFWSTGSDKKPEKYISCECECVKVLHYILWMNNVCHCVETNYVVIYVWMDECSTHQTAKSYYSAAKTKAGKKNFPFLVG